MAKAEYRSAIRSKKLICMALADLLQEKPLDKITVTDVVRRAEINRGTFYAHYTDIPDVLHHVIKQTFSHIRESVFESNQPKADIPHVLLHGIQEILESDLDFCKKVMASSASSMMEEELVKLVLDYLIQHEDEYCQGNYKQYEMTIRFCAGGLSVLYRDWFSGKLPLTLDHLTKQAEALLNRIISAAQPILAPLPTPVPQT